jgi:3'(2'), 5'-bisphosphate nucleotidase
MLETVSLLDVVMIAKKAGKKILTVYGKEDFGIESKEDNSPVTIADKQANALITEELERLYPEIPILSEEGQHLSYEERKKWDYFWLVDPLDGTKEFIKRNGEFTVNIALVHKGYPVLGVIYAPVLDLMYASKEGVGAYKLANADEKLTEQLGELLLLSEMEKLTGESNNEKTIIVGSRSHLSEETKEYVEKLKENGDVEFLSIGSSLKLCMVAEGKADVYPRFGPTMEWDTAAGQAIVEQAGGTVVETKTGERFRYNKEILKNPYFIAKGSW